jgi:hypothetical protein
MHMDDQQKDEAIWKLAKKRAGFKWSLMIYIAVNTFLIIAWLFSPNAGHFFWPAWSVSGWGIGIAFQYINAYHSGGNYFAEAEYKKLKKQNQL